jgi:hypothetical protein
MDCRVTGPLWDVLDGFRQLVVSKDLTLAYYPAPRVYFTVEDLNKMAYGAGCGNIYSIINNLRAPIFVAPIDNSDRWVMDLPKFTARRYIMFITLQFAEMVPKKVENAPKSFDFKMIAGDISMNDTLIKGEEMAIKLHPLVPKELKAAAEFDSKGFNSFECTLTVQTVLTEYFNLCPRINPFVILQRFTKVLKMYKSDDEENHSILYKPDLNIIRHSRRTRDKIAYGCELILLHFYNEQFMPKFTPCGHYHDLAKMALMKEVPNINLVTAEFLVDRSRRVDLSAKTWRTSLIGTQKLRSMRPPIPINETYKIVRDKCVEGKLFTEFEKISFCICNPAWDNIAQYKIARKVPGNAGDLDDIVDNEVIYMEKNLNAAMKNHFSDALLSKEVNINYLDTYWERVIQDILVQPALDKIVKGEIMSQDEWDTLMWGLHNVVTNYTHRHMDWLRVYPGYSVAIKDQILSNSDAWRYIYFMYAYKVHSQLLKEIADGEIFRMERHVAEFAEEINKSFGAKATKPTYAEITIDDSKEVVMKLEKLREDCRRLNDERIKTKFAEAISEDIYKKIGGLQQGMHNIFANKSSENDTPVDLVMDADKKERAINWFEKEYPGTPLKVEEQSWHGGWSLQNMHYATFELFDRVREREFNAKYDEYKEEIKKYEMKNYTLEDQPYDTNMRNYIKGINGLEDFTNHWNRFSRKTVTLDQIFYAYNCVLSREGCSRHKVPGSIKRGDWQMLVNAMCRHYGKSDMFKLCNRNMKRVNKAYPDFSKEESRKKLREQAVKNISEFMESPVAKHCLSKERLNELLHYKMFLLKIKTVKDVEDEIGKKWKDKLIIPIKVEQIPDVKIMPRYESEEVD